MPASDAVSRPGRNARTRAALVAAAWKLLASRGPAAARILD